MQNASGTPLTTLVLNTPRAVKKSRARADQRETGISLSRGWTIGSILSNERMHSELSAVENSVDVHFDRLQVGRA